jgi:riboflavin kinase/FMN adenylyltransferase
MPIDVQYGFERPDRYRGGFVSIGNFDGVHRGHEQIGITLAERAHRHGAKAVVLTFDPPPAAILSPDRLPPRILTLEERARRLGKLGIECMIVFPTTPEFLKRSAEDFFRAILCDELQARGVVEGPDFRFGHRRAGDLELLRRLCSEQQMSLDVVNPLLDAQGRVISSTRLREALRDGRMRDANEMLSTPYQITGLVGRGAQRGRTLGFPTANLQQIPELLPADGVYAGVCPLPAKTHAAAVHIGPNATFGEDAKKVEMHLLDFSGDLYGQPLMVELLDRVRGTKKFESADALRAQLIEDVRRVSEIVCEGQSRSL